MARLASSTPTAPQTVRVLFYGQSITKQSWWRAVAEDLRRRYPSAQLIIENRAIGGYSTPRLIRTMEADILPFHPDLIVFHDYGPEDLYEKIVVWIRSHTTADLLLQSDHVVWLPGEEDPEGARRRSYDFQERHSFEWMPALAQKYGLGLVDIRGAWHAHLKDKGLAPKALLRDAVHLNEAGEALYAEITRLYLIPTASSAPAAAHFRDYPASFRNGELRLSFSGTRVELLDGEGGPLQVLIDGQAPAQNPSLYYHSRPTNTWDADWPTVIHVGRATASPLPRIEEWTLKVTNKRMPSGLHFDFEVFGSVTGPDGGGSSERPFQSTSGLVTLLPEDYDVERSYGLHKINMPNSWQVRWATLPRFVDPYLPRPGAATVVYGLSNARHTLLLRGQGRVKTIRVYTPPLAL